MSSDHPREYSTLVVGGGPAGLSCSLWLMQRGLTPVVIDRREQLGGCLNEISRPNSWCLGFPDETSQSLARRFAGHARQASIEIRLKTELKEVRSSSDRFEITIEGAETEVLAARTVVFALGVVPRGLESLDLESDLKDSPEAWFDFDPLGHLDEPKRYENRRVAVIGGGDNAHFTVKDIAEEAREVILIRRSQPAAQAWIRGEVEALIASGAVVEVAEDEIAGLHPNRDESSSLDLRLKSGAILNGVHRIFGRIGYAPRLERIEAVADRLGLERESSGYFAVDSEGRTSHERIYAVGDVASPERQSVVEAIASGAAAARALEIDLRKETR